MNNRYLIPANSKRSQLILSFFRPIDLFLFGGGVLVTLMMLLFIHDVGFWGMILILTPTLVTGFLVLPIPYYHNVLQFIVNIYSYFSNKKKYIWRGWCINGEE